MMMHHCHGSSSAGAQSPRRQSSEAGSRPPSANAPSPRKLWGSNRSRCGSLFPLRRVNAAGGSSGGSSNAHRDGGNNMWAPERLRRSRSQPNRQRAEQWTTSDRALRVSQNRGLSDLLAAEVERAGVVTAAGYRSVHQEFLYSEAVEQEMRKNRPAGNNDSGNNGRRRGNVFQLRSSRFGNLLASSIGAASRHSPLNSQTNASENSPEKVAGTLRSTSGSSNESSKSNIAPRRSSQVRDLTQSHREMLEQETREYEDHERRKLMMDSYVADLDRGDNGEDDDDDQSLLEEVLSMNSSFCSQDSSVVSLPKDITTKDGSSCSFQRRDSNDSLDIDDIFDMVNESEIFPSLGSQDAVAATSAGCGVRQSNESSLTGHPDSLDVLTAACTTFSTLDTLSVEFKEVNFDPDIRSHADELELSVQTSDHDRSYTDKCGWLPWPERRSESSNGDDYDIGNSDGSKPAGAGELLEPFQLPRNDTAFLPWATAPNSNRACAA